MEKRNSCPGVTVGTREVRGHPGRAAVALVIGAMWDLFPTTRKLHVQTWTESLLKGVGKKKNVKLGMSFELSENFLWAPKL